MKRNRKEIVRLSFFLMVIVLLTGCEYYNEKKVKGQEYLIMKCGGSFYAVTPFDEIYFNLGEGEEEPVLEEGHFAIMTADATLVTGGAAGFVEKPYINKILQFEEISEKEAIKRADLQNFLYSEHYRENEMAYFYHDDQLYYLSGRVYGYSEDGDRHNYYYLYKNGEQGAKLEEDEMIQYINVLTTK